MGFAVATCLFWVCDNYGACSNPLLISRTQAAVLGITFPLLLSAAGTVVSSPSSILHPGIRAWKAADVYTQGAFGCYAGFNVVALVMIFFWVPGKFPVQHLLRFW